LLCSKILRAESLYLALYDLKFLMAFNFNKAIQTNHYKSCTHQPIPYLKKIKIKINLVIV